MPHHCTGHLSFPGLSAHCPASLRSCYVVGHLQHMAAVHHSRSAAPTHPISRAPRAPAAEEFAAIKKVVQARPAAPADLAEQGLGFAAKL